VSDLVPVKRALISVSDKTGLAEFARALHEEFHVELISTGGTAKFLREQGLSVTDVSTVTGFPEMMDGRIKTLHPKIHGGLLALRDDAEHAQAMKTHGIQPIDLVCINLYPFEKTIAKPGVTFEEAIENIDIGGPAMVRSAAKNHRYVLVVTSPDRYDKVLGDLRQHNGASCGKHRLKQAQRAFAHTALYDRVIADYLESRLTGNESSANSVGWLTGVWQAIQKIAFPRSAESQEAVELPVQGQRRIPETTFVNDLLMTQAVAVGGTEAAAFECIEHPEVSLELLAHIRPDNASTAIRDQALAAFRDIIAPCVQQRRNGAIEVGSHDENSLTKQYCLVALMWRSNEIRIANAIIVPAIDTDEAKQKLRVLEMIGNQNLQSLRSQSVLSRDTPADNGQTHLELKERLSLSLSRKQDLRYGENPHQKGALYVDRQPNEASVAFSKQLHGKELSYINLLDADGALSCVKEFKDPAACIVKHTTPCGCAIGKDLAEAFKKAFEGDPLAAFGGIVALNRDVDLAAAQSITSINVFLEVIVAPSFKSDALELIKCRWKNIRLLEVGPITTQDRNEPHMHKIVGGYLVQERDLIGLDQTNWKVVSTRKPNDKEMADLSFAWLVCKHVKSNAIVLARDGMLVGAGAGQMDRPSAARLAIAKAGDRATGSVAASDAFFPFPDAPELLLSAGATAIIQPGGSVKDQETIDLVNRLGAAMVMTGQRHFKH